MNGHLEAVPMWLGALVRVFGREIEKEKGIYDRNMKRLIEKVSADSALAERAKNMCKDA